MNKIVIGKKFKIKDIINTVVTYIDNSLKQSIPSIN